MAVKIEQGEVFTARLQALVSIESLMIHTHDALVASVERTEPVPASIIRACIVQIDS